MRVAAKPKTNLLEAAIESDDGDSAVAAIRRALGIPNGNVANLPLEWPHDRDQRANALREWLSNELRFLVYHS